MDDNGSRGLIWGAITVLTCILIGFYANNFRESANMANTAHAKSIDTISELMNSDINMYEGLEVRGSEVISQINRLKNQDLAVKVVTKKTGAYYNRVLTSEDTVIGEVSTRNIKDVYELTSMFYINKFAKFTGKVLYDINNTIIGLEFVQK